jgi:dUTPase
VILVNFGQSPFTMNRGDRIAQMISRRSRARPSPNATNWHERALRAEGGFGSTGTRPKARR